MRKEQWPPILGMGSAICNPGGGASALLTSDRIYAVSCDVTESTWRLILNKTLATKGQPRIANDTFQSVVTTALEWNSGKFFYSLLKTTGIDAYGRPVYRLKFRVGDTPVVQTVTADVVIDSMPVSPGAKLGIPLK